MLTNTRHSFGRAFHVIWIFYFLSFVVIYALLPSIPLQLRELGASVKESGRFTTAFMLGSGVGALFTGPLGDRWGQRTVLKWAAVISAACLTAYACLSHIWLFFLVGIPHGIIWSGFRTGTLAWVGGFLSEERRAEGFAIFGMAAPGGAAIGPILGIWLMPRFGFSVTMLTLAILSVSLFFILGKLPDLKRQTGKFVVPGHEAEVIFPTTSAGDTPASKSWYSGFMRRTAIPEWLLTPAIVMACMAISYGAIPSYGTQEAVDHNFLWTSALVSCYGIGMVLLRLILGLHGMGENPMRLLPIMLALNIAAALGMAIMPGGLIRHILCGLLYGASFGMAFTLVWTYVMGRAEAKRRGAITGFLYFAYDLSIGLGSFILGFPMEHLGYRWGWAAGAISLCVAWFFGYRLGARGRVLRS